MAKPARSSINSQTEIPPGISSMDSRSSAHKHSTLNDRMSCANGLSDRSTTASSSSASSNIIKRTHAIYAPKSEFSLRRLNTSDSAGLIKLRESGSGVLKNPKSSYEDMFSHSTFGTIYEPTVVTTHSGMWGQESYRPVYHQASGIHPVSHNNLPGGLSRAVTQLGQRSTSRVLNPPTRSVVEEMPMIYAANRSQTMHLVMRSASRNNNSPNGQIMTRFQHEVEGNNDSHAHGQSNRQPAVSTIRQSNVGIHSSAQAAFRRAGSSFTIESTGSSFFGDSYSRTQSGRVHEGTASRSPADGFGNKFSEDRDSSSVMYRKQNGTLRKVGSSSVVIFEDPDPTEHHFTSSEKGVLGKRMSGFEEIGEKERQQTNRNRKRKVQHTILPVDPFLEDAEICSFENSDEDMPFSCGGSPSGRFGRSLTVHFELDKQPISNAAKRTSRSLPAHVRKQQFIERELLDEFEKELLMTGSGSTRNDRNISTVHHGKPRCVHEGKDLVAAIDSLTRDYDLEALGGSLIQMQNKELISVRDPIRASELQQELTPRKFFGDDGFLLKPDRIINGSCLKLNESSRPSSYSHNMIGKVNLSDSTNSSVSTTPSIPSRDPTFTDNHSPSDVHSQRSEKKGDRMMRRLKSTGNEYSVVNEEAALAFGRAVWECLGREGAAPPVSSGNSILSAETRASVVAWIGKVVEAMKWPTTCYFIAVHALDNVLSCPATVAAMKIDESVVPLLSTACVLAGVCSECEHREVQKMKHFVGQVPNVNCVKDILTKQIEVTVHMKEGCLVNKTPADFLLYYMANVKGHSEFLNNLTLECGFLSQETNLYERILRCDFVPQQKLLFPAAVVNFVRNAGKGTKQDISPTSSENFRKIDFRSAGLSRTDQETINAIVSKYSTVTSDNFRAICVENLISCKKSRGLMCSCNRSIADFGSDACCVPFVEVLFEVILGCSVLAFNRGLYSMVPYSRVVAASMLAMCSVWLAELSDIKFVSEFCRVVFEMDYHSVILPVARQLPKFSAVCMFANLMDPSSTKSKSQSPSPAKFGALSTPAVAMLDLLLCFECIE